MNLIGAATSGNTVLRVVYWMRLCPTGPNRPHPDAECFIFFVVRTTEASKSSFSFWFMEWGVTAPYSASFPYFPIWDREGLSMLGSRRCLQAQRCGHTGSNSTPHATFPQRIPLRNHASAQRAFQGRIPFPR